MGLGNGPIEDIVLCTLSCNFEGFSYLVSLITESGIRQVSLFSSYKVECFNHAVIRQNRSLLHVVCTEIEPCARKHIEYQKIFRGVSQSFNLNITFIWGITLRLTNIQSYMCRKLLFF